MLRAIRLRKILKWFAIFFAGLVGVALLGVAIIYVLMGNELKRTFDGVGTSIRIPDDPASIAEGERLARLRGCNDGCQGKGVRGAVFFDAPDGTRLVAPNLARVAQNYTVEELELIIRHGIRPDGTSVVIAMPSIMFYHLSDTDLGAMIAFLQSQPPGDTKLPDTRIGPVGRLFFLYFKKMFGALLSADEVHHDAPRLDSSRADATVYGRYLAMTICVECHGTDLRGAPDGFAPSLAIVAAYSIENFRELMRSGRPIGGRKLDLMAQVAESRFSHFTDAEIDGLHTYLRTLADAAPEN